MIQAGSQQERFVENFLEEEWKTMNYQTSQGIYGVAKILARNIASKLCYLNQIQFINVRFCSYVPDDIGGSGFVDSTLKSILTGGKNPNPQSTQWTEIVPIKEIARAFVLAGFYGVNNADYYVGTSTPHKLKEYFNYFILAVKGHQNPESAWNIYSIDERDQRHFDPQLLYSHVGFELEDDFASFTQRILAK
jgi:nucleoside-diphosphate-sugar epimerase